MKQLINKIILFAAFFIANASIAQEVKVFEYTGKFQTYIVPEGVTMINVELQGAGGGFSSWEKGRYPDKYKPGKGGKLTASYPVEPGQKIYVFVGGKGDNATDTYQGKGGFNGGGDGNNTGEYGPFCGGGGGGASDIRIGGSGLEDRILVAGGGGGAGSNWPVGGDHGGDGGGLTAVDGQSKSEVGHESTGRGGTQSAGGIGGKWITYPKAEDGKLGRGGHAPDSTSGGGGGGGYYGGGAGCWSGGGGGSSYADAKATSVNHVQGVNSDNGKVVISPGCIPLEIEVNGPTTMCFGEEIVLKGKSDNNSKFEWDKGVQNGVPFKPPVGTTTYTVKSSNPKECPNTIDIKVNEKGVVLATTTDGTICEGEYTTLIVHGASGEVHWSNGVKDGVPFQPPAGVNTYKVVKEGACGGEDEIQIVVNKILIKRRTMVEETADHLGKLEVNIEGGTFPYTYKWRKDGKVISTQRDLVDVKGGSYELEVTDVIGCTDKNTFTITQLMPYIEPDTGPKLEAEIDQEQKFVTVSYPGAFEYKIENMENETVITGHSVDQDIVDITKLPPGTYRVSLIFKQIKQYVTFVKE
ncbi:glycine rich domain-containing protein [Paracrocinitomix mangrovi]|uniref:glycine rich domain-containing protein n=1 Tax=Paracrocinitomix mangrovi TaxID=2862509 RepID=UPI001C8E8EDB|nr:glycine rich domain-containing protein [Paracrocinitomix mangrovi]UKN01126.1 glycine rich domain-containing protein [Paracrocinitomix mangrovi]